MPKMNLLHSISTIAFSSTVSATNLTRPQRAPRPNRLIMDTSEVSPVEELPLNHLNRYIGLVDDPSIEGLRKADIEMYKVQRIIKSFFEIQTTRYPSPLHMAPRLDFGKFRQTMEKVDLQTVFVIELASMGDLFHVIWSVVPYHRFFKHLIAGLQHMHSKDIIHLDLKPENLFISANTITFNTRLPRHLHSPPIFAAWNSSSSF
ncbi:hypothetical protein L3Y34_000509 [Caenorhabditis briggsae]|uniref:Protein kinase domain-containing protein n=1 Tax=Caenorhabditis briggsae TaxID=6238 RepID=A0AAE9D9S9_CAEBR|nr:hypothetical protein L3Y34_000509 [Caenorhabditis briggsae]